MNRPKITDTPQVPKTLSAYDERSKLTNIAQTREQSKTDEQFHNDKELELTTSPKQTKILTVRKINEIVTGKFCT